MDNKFEGISNWPACQGIAEADGFIVSLAPRQELRFGIICRLIFLFFIFIFLEMQYMPYNYGG